MSEFFVSRDRKLVIGALRKLGLSLKDGSRHTKAECISNKNKTTIPRHSKIKREIVNSVCDFLIKKNYDKEKLKNFLKIR